MRGEESQPERPWIAKNRFREWEEGGIIKAIGFPGRFHYSYIKEEISFDPDRVAARDR
jgi:hypothetical protein